MILFCSIRTESSLSFSVVQGAVSVSECVTAPELQRYPDSLDSQAFSQRHSNAVLEGRGSVGQLWRLEPQQDCSALESEVS